jgi:putative membrane protein
MNAQTDMMSQPSDIQGELSAIGAELALERTLLAWIRTALTFIGFGFTLAKFVHDMISQGMLRGVNPEYPRQLGFTLMALGIVSLIGAAGEYVQTRKRIRMGTGLRRWSMSLAITVFLAIVCLLLMVNIFFELKI